MRTAIQCRRKARDMHRLAAASRGLKAEYLQMAHQWEFLAVEALCMAAIQTQLTVA